MFTFMLMLMTYWCLSLCPNISPDFERATLLPECSVENNISFIPLLAPTGPSSITYWHSRYGFKISRYPSRFHVLLALLLSGQVESNPGPKSPKFPCGECSKAVRWGKSIACDTCDRWCNKNSTYDWQKFKDIRVQVERVYLQIHI